MSLFEKQLTHYSEKFNKLYAQLGKKDVITLYKKCGLADVEAGLRGNTKEFRVATLKIAMTLVPGTPSCTVYAAVVAAACEALGISFTIKAGTCLKPSMKSYEKDKAYIAEQKAAGIQHPLMITHVYLETEDKIYEYYSGDFEGIEHIDCVELVRY